MIIYTDSDPAIKEFELICDEEVNWNKIGNMDLWSQMYFTGDRNIELRKIKGHSADKINAYVDYLTWQKHKYRDSQLIIQGRLMKRTRLPNDNSHFRLYDIVDGIKKETLDVDKFKNQIKKLKNQLYLLTTPDLVSPTSLANG